MADIYDYFSRKHFNNLSHREHVSNDKIIESFGKYIGVLTKSQAQTIRNQMEILAFKRAQIGNLNEEFNSLKAACDEMTESALGFLKANNCSTKSHDLYVDSRGHCWVVSKTDMK
jgi:hypothetical protein